MEKLLEPIVIVSGLTVVFDCESVTRTVKVVVPAAVGLPDSTPAGLSESPAGNGPLSTAHV